MRLHLFIALTLLAVAPAHAHGEEILVSFYAQAIAVAACFVGLQIVPVAKPHRLSGSIACIAGVVLAEFVVSNVPYNDNRVVITMAMVILPIMAAAGSVLIGRASANRKAKT